ncbi:MAG: putative Transposon Ty3-G Gag-Pol polyprotein, partial [Streblomastix strix]
IACFYGLAYITRRIRYYSSTMTVRLQNRNNQLDDNSNDEDGNDQKPGFRAKATFPFYQFTTAIDTASDNDPDCIDSQALLSVKDDYSSEIHASGDEEVFNEEQSSHLRRHDELENDSNIDSITPNENDEIPGTKRGRLDETDSETERETSDSDFIASQDPETKPMIQKQAPRTLMCEKQIRKAAVRLVEARIHQKAKNYDEIDSDLEDDNIRALGQKLRKDLTPFVITDPPEIVGGERNPQIGNIVRNLVAAQRTNFVAIWSQFLIGKEETTERIVDTLEQIGQATTDAQQIRKQNLSYRNSNFSYRPLPASAAISPRDKKLMKEDRSINQHSRSRQRCCFRSISFSRGRNSNRRGRGRRFNNNYNSSKYRAHNQITEVPTSMEQLRSYICSESRNIIKLDFSNRSNISAKEMSLFRISMINSKNESIYMKAVKEELDLGIVREVKDREIMFYNKTFIIPRKDGRLRKIMDFRPINKNLKDVPFQNENFQNVCNLQLKGDWATIIDIHNSYNHVLVSDKLQKFLAFGSQGHTYTQVDMPFGLRTALYIFNQHLQPAITRLRTLGIRIIVYIEDILILNQNPESLVQQTVQVKELLEKLG